MGLFITGVAGLVGANLAKTMLQRVGKIAGIDNLCRGSVRNLGPVLGHLNFAFEAADLADIDAYRRTLIEFQPDDSVVVSPIICERATIRELETSIIAFYTGTTRSASSVLGRQSDGIAVDAGKQHAVKRIAQLAYDLRDELSRNNAGAIGEVLHESWMLKKSLTQGISTDEIDGWYQAARSAGAIGGKILGAGAGGFLMLFAPQESREAIKAALPMLRHVQIGFEPLGSQIIFYH